jgi:hypothetical protein
VFSCKVFKTYQPVYLLSILPIQPLSIRDHIVTPKQDLYRSVSFNCFFHLSPFAAIVKKTISSFKSECSQQLRFSKNTFLNRLSQFRFTVSCKLQDMRWGNTKQFEHLLTTFYTGYSLSQQGLSFLFHVHQLWKAFTHNTILVNFMTIAHAQAYHT